MKLYVRRLGSKGYTMSWDNRKDQYVRQPDGQKVKIDYESLVYKKEDGWHEVEREPDIAAGEFLEYDEQSDRIIIKKREQTSEALETERKHAEDRTLQSADTIRDLKARVEALEAKLAALGVHK